MTTGEVARARADDATESSLRILQVSTYDTIGGAERVAWNLFRTYRTRGHASWLAVGHQLGDDPGVFPVPNREERGRWARAWCELQSRLESSAGRIPGAASLARFAGLVAKPRRALDDYRGVEDFHYPGTWRLLNSTDQRPQIVHGHNLHGRYFDLRALPWLSMQVPLVLTLHDAWLLSGHCAHSLECERWRTGCGQCPDLTLDPPMRRDATAYNWRRKREIFAGSRLFVATPSEWLMRKVDESMLATGVVEARVIPNGVDLAVFRPSDQRECRAALSIPNDARVILFAATAIRRNPWKDYRMVREAVDRTARALNGQSVVFLAMGEDAPPERVGAAEVRFFSHTDPVVVARCYAAADVYVHAARADTFPNTVLEALACGTPVVATEVGGIPEQVDEARTGFLVPPGDAEALADRTTRVLLDAGLRQRMGMSAVEAVRERFDLGRQADAYLDWYYELAHERRIERLARGA
jgi:glycosyltransferase involved in cell wall biosynthesis